MQQDELDHISLSYLRQFFHLPLVDVAKHLNVSLTALKRVCRKQGLPRWPYRQINSIDNEISSMQDKCLSKLPLAAGELTSHRAQIKGLVHKKELIVRSAVEGVDPIVRGAIYLTDVSGVDEEELFDPALLPQFVAALKTVKKRKKMRGFFLGDILDAVRRNGVMPAEITNASPAGVNRSSGNSGRGQLPLPPLEGLGLKQRLARNRSAEARQRGRRGRGRRERERDNCTSEEDSEDEEDDNDEIGTPTARRLPPSRRERPPQQTTQLPPAPAAAAAAAAAAVAATRMVPPPSAPASTSSEELLLLYMDGDCGNGNLDEDGEKAGLATPLRQRRRERERNRRGPGPAMEARSEEAQMEHAEEVFRKLIWRSSLRGNSIATAAPHLGVLDHWDAAVAGDEFLTSGESQPLKRARRDSGSAGSIGDAASASGCLSPVSWKRAAGAAAAHNNGFSPNTASTDSGWTSGEDVSISSGDSGSGMFHVDSSCGIFETAEMAVALAYAPSEKPQHQHQLLPAAEPLLQNQSLGDSWLAAAAAASNNNNNNNGGADVWGETSETAAMSKHGFAAGGSGSGSGFLWEASDDDGEAAAAALATGDFKEAAPSAPEDLYLEPAGPIGFPGMQLTPLPWGDF